MLAKKYKSEIVSISNPFEGIYTLEFKSLGKAYKYKPGQFLHLAIDEDYDGMGQWPDSRCFSMQSSPSEDTIKITYAVKGVFTNKMSTSLRVGNKVWLKLPYGDLFQQVYSKVNTVFIAGGTGITPFLSLFNDESFNKYINPKIYIGFRNESYNIYNCELEKIKNDDPDIKIILEDIDGVINIENIFEVNGTKAVYFISGPPGMIKHFKNQLIKRGVTASHVFTDDWA